MAAQLGNAFALVHELDFGEAKLLALGKILGRFVGQIGLAKRSVNYRVHHSRYLHVSFSLRSKRRNRHAARGLARLFFPKRRN
jgi:hypothetical protein